MFLKRITPGSRVAKTVILQERVVNVARTTKVVKGGRIFSFSVFIVVGDGKGVFGYGSGAAKEVSIARKKAFNNAKKRLYSVAIRSGRTISHDVTGYCGSTKILLRPADAGTGVIAGGAAKLLLEVAGFKDVVAKCFGPSSNRVATTLATIDALSNVCSLRTLSNLRGKSATEILSNVKKDKFSSDDDKSTDDSSSDQQEVA